MYRHKTCNDKCIDSFIVKKELCHAVYSVNVIAGGVFSPHCPVRLLLRAVPRCIQVKTLVAPKGYQAKLPFGPPTQKQGQEAQAADNIASGKSTLGINVEEESVKLIGFIERQLATISGFDDQDADRHSGRKEGPGTTLVCPMTLGGGQPRTSPAQRAWKRTSG